jgi:hypothetical protein
MAAANYLARFGSPHGEFFGGVCAWTAVSAPLLPFDWWHILRAHSAVDIAVRVGGGDEPQVTLLLTADRADPLRAILNTLAGSTLPAGLRQAQDAGTYDGLTAAGLPSDHLRVQHEGYHHNGQPLGCDFRLFSTWSGQGLPQGVAYQVALRSYRPDREHERQVRKYLAWLDLEQPFTPLVRQVQGILGRRLLTPGWLADEYLLFSDAATRAAWYERIRAHFLGTTGRLGFREAPLEMGDFSDRVAVGYHSARNGEVASGLAVQAACTFSEDEVEWFFRQRLGPPALGPGSDVPDVFISYASGDYMHADAARQHLEGTGWCCWIAPRDINTTGLPYTEAIMLAIKQVRAVLVLLSPSANLSVHIPRELDLALERKLPILPMRLVNLLPTGQLGYLLRTCQWIDVFGREFGDAMGELTRRLRNLGI